MPNQASEGTTGAPDPLPFKRVVEILGGPAVLKQQLKDPFDAHDLLLRGLPSGALLHLMHSFVLFKDQTSLGKAIGMSLRTFQRRKGDAAKPLSLEHSGRTWKFAEILAKATSVFGSREEAERWLERPALGLDQRRPIDLLATTAGVEIVENHLDRLEYGVYT
jgi:putative toxin-antitoxin system antitoxin component (TIGR02293 family)